MNYILNKYCENIWSNKQFVTICHAQFLLCINTPPPFFLWTHFKHDNKMKVSENPCPFSSVPYKTNKALISPTQQTQSFLTGTARHGFFTLSGFCLQMPTGGEGKFPGNVHAASPHSGCATVRLSSALRVCLCIPGQLTLIVQETDRDTLVPRSFLPLKNTLTGCTGSPVW